MDDERREILNQVAAGTITAQEGAARLESLESGAQRSTPVGAATATATQIRKIEVITRFGNTEVLGDPTVASAVADGPHQARIEGDTMVIEQQSPVTDDTAFEFNRPYARLVLPRFDFNRKLTVRMNPALSLRGTVQAGNLRIDGVEGPVTSDVQAGNCTVDGFGGPIRLLVAAGNIEASGHLDGGSSAIRCQMGEVKVKLDKGSSVRINAHTTMGKVAIEGVKDQTIGSGAGTLDIDCMMGNVRVDVA